jgi:hypothetical protein
MTIQIKSFDSIDDLERLAIVDFSYSRLDTYQQCPSRYFYTYIQKEPRHFAEAAVLRKHSPFCIRRYCFKR